MEDTPCTLLDSLPSWGTYAAYIDGITKLFPHFLCYGQWPPVKHGRVGQRCFFLTWAHWS